MILKEKASIIISSIAVLIAAVCFVKINQQKKEITLLKKELVELIYFKESIENIGQPLKNGEEAPSFSLLDANGRTRQLSKEVSKNKKILVFTANDCPYCNDYYPVLNEFTLKHPKIEVLVIQEGSSPGDNFNFLDSTGYTFEMLSGTSQVLDEYRILGTPTTVILDENNRVDTSVVVEDMVNLEKVFFN